MKQTTIFTENKTIATPLIIAARISREKNRFQWLFINESIIHTWINGIRCYL
jgi:hypothetical protein